MSESMQITHEQCVSESTYVRDVSTNHIPQEVMIMKLKDIDRRLRYVQQERATRAQEQVAWQTLVSNIRSVDDSDAQAKLETILKTLSTMSRVTLNEQDFASAEGLSRYTLRALLSFCNRNQHEHMESAFFNATNSNQNGLSAMQAWTIRNAVASFVSVAEALHLS
jgi:hypothetical protein